MSEFHLSIEEKRFLLNIARSSIKNALNGVSLPISEPASVSLMEKRGAFVTIEKESRLRGCIGNMESDLPLYKTISDMAVAAAFRDPRFPPLREEEFEEIRIEISVLSPLSRLENKDQLVVGEHGIMIRKGYNSGVLLPQVARKYKWSQEDFLRQTCLKAGLQENAWNESDSEVWIFCAMVFGEGKHHVDPE